MTDTILLLNHSRLEAISQSLPLITTLGLPVAADAKFTRQIPSASLTIF